ncbi:MAG TPA: cyanophycinase [Bacteroidetes bacterium]|nr:cyanophycinase [Bacteroidota bacterium]
MIKGTLIPIGGNEDKGGEESENYTLDFIQEGILSHVVKESGGISANIVVIPTASSIPVEVGKNYLQAFDKLGCENVNVLNLDQRSQASKPEFLKWVEQADCVMFSGGDQSEIIDKIGATPMHDLLMERYRNENFVIAGTSAGAMCMSSEMIMGGRSSESLFKGAVKMREGMGFIPSLVIDSHFIQRGRFGRLTEAVARFPQLMGVGLAEDTGLIIKNGNECTVIGSGMVIMFDPSALQHNNAKILEEGTPMTITNMVTHVLSNSDSFHLDRRETHVLPIDAEFI